MRSFLTGFTGVQLGDAKKVCEEVLLPKVLVSSPKPNVEDLVKFTKDCCRILGSGLPDGTEIWVKTKDDYVRPSKETLLPSEYQPQPNWEINKKYVVGLKFISPDYLDGSVSAHLSAWRSFFRRGGVKEIPDNGVEDFAVGIVSEYLGTVCSDVERVEKRNVGYDIEARASDGQVMRVEVKGQATENNVELTDNETRAADKHKDDFFLIVVCGIPENPKLYRIQNPMSVGVKDKLTIPISVWKTGLITP